MPQKITTPVERIDQIIAAYHELGREAHDLLDLAVAEYVSARPGVPAGIVKQCNYTNPAGHMLNVPVALQILRKRFQK